MGSNHPVDKRKNQLLIMVTATHLPEAGTSGTARKGATHKGDRRILLVQRCGTTRATYASPHYAFDIIPQKYPLGNMTASTMR